MAGDMAGDMAGEMPGEQIVMWHGRWHERKYSLIFKYSSLHKMLPTKLCSDIFFDSLFESKNI